MMTRALTKIVFCVIFGTLASNLQPTVVAARDGTSEKLKAWTMCQGDNLVLNEPVSEVTAHHVYVFRNGESVASTSVPATGQLEGRLLVKADSSVEITNLSSSDLGIYRVEVKMSEDQSTERSTRLVVGEPPETADGKLMAILDMSNDTVIRLKCGLFTSLGYPPVSAVWKDPGGQILTSTGFTGSHFTLDLPVDVARSGHYCCHLDCRDPNVCCLDDQSPLRQCAPIDVNTNSKTDNHERPTEESALVKHMELDRLERRVSAIDTIVQELERSERQQQSQMCVAAMFYQVQREAKCEQLDSSVDKLLNVQGELWGELNATRNNLSTALQHSASVETTLKEAFVGQQHKADSLMTKVSGELIDVKSRLSVSEQVLDGLQTTVNEDVINYLYNINQSKEELQARIEISVSSIHDRMNDTLKKELAKLQEKIDLRQVSAEIYQTQRNVSDIFQQSFRQELSKQQSMLEAWMATMTLDISRTKDDVSSTKNRCAVVEDVVREDLKGHQQKLEAWMLKMSEELSQIKNTLRTSEQLAAHEKKIENQVSEVSTKVTGLGNSLEMHVGRTTEFFKTVQWVLSGECPMTKGYTLHGKRCLKLNATLVDFESAKNSCAADGGHLVHLQSYEQDVPPLLDLFIVNGIELKYIFKNYAWVGLDDILTEGTFVWSDGTNLPAHSTLWSPGQPDDYLDNEDCVHIRYYNDRLELNDLDCARRLKFVCQIDLRAN